MIDSMLARRSIRMVLAATLLAGVAPCPAIAADIRIEPAVGFHGVFQLGRPFPLAVSLENAGGPADGILEVEVWKRGVSPGAPPHAALYRREVFLPARSSRTVHFTVDPDLLSRPLTIRFQAGTRRASGDVDLRRHFSPAPVVLTVSEGDALPLASLGASFTNRIVSIHSGALPADARALAGVSHLVLYDQSLRDLSRAQSLALDTWLAAGGTMVIAGSLNFALYQEPQLARYLPVRVTGARRVAFSPQADAGNEGVIDGVWSQTITDVKGRLSADSRGLPVLVESGWGKGRVVYLALDAGRPPLASWSALPRFLQGLLGAPAEASPPLRAQWNEAVFSRLLLSPWFIASYIPTRALLFAILAYLAGLVVLLRLWQRRRVGPRAMACWGGGWILCSALSGYLFFSRGGHTPEAVLLAATVLEDAGDGYVDAQTNLALFSTQRREYNLGFGRNWLELAPLLNPGPSQGGRPAVYRQGGGMTRLTLPVQAWGYELIRARHIERLGVSARIVPRETELTLEVTNDSGRDLTECWFVAPGLRVALGDLPRGHAWRRTFPLDAGGGDGGANEGGAAADIAGLRALRFRDAAHDILFHGSFFSPDGARALSRGRAAIFLGWVRAAEPRVDVGDPRVRIESHALYRAIVALPAPEEE